MLIQLKIDQKFVTTQNLAPDKLEEKFVATKEGHQEKFAAKEMVEEFVAEFPVEEFVFVSQFGKQFGEQEILRLDWLEQQLHTFLNL